MLNMCTYHICDGYTLVPRVLTCVPSIKNNQGEALDEEIRKVRSAVITLKNQKKLSETDQNLLKMLQRQLKSLAQQKQDQYRE